MKVLIVDDSKAMRMIVRRTMREAGFHNHRITEAEDGLDALEKIKHEQPHVVLSDWSMPKMTGIELLHALRAQNVQTRFGFVATVGNVEMREQASAAGADFVLTKPFTVESFQTTVGPVFEQRV